MSSVEWTTHCADVTRSLPVDTTARNNLLVELWVMSGLAHECQSIFTLISEDIVKESSVYQMIIERGFEQGVQQGVQQGIEQGKQLGAKAFAIQHILDVLNDRFKVNIAATLTPALEAIDDLENFRGLLQHASNAEHLEDFIHALETYSNGGQ